MAGLLSAGFSKYIKTSNFILKSDGINIVKNWRVSG